MINLLPPDVKNSYRYARSNVILRKWVVFLVFALIGLAAIGTFGLLTIQQSSSHYTKEIAATEATFAKEDYAGVQKRVQDISGSFKLVVKVLGQEVLFSKLINQIGATIPAQANLVGLNINQSQSAIDISANAVDYNTATQVQVNLADPKNKIFSKADIVNIACTSKTDPTSPSPQYPCTVSIKALFSNTNDYLFINSGSKAKP